MRRREGHGPASRCPQPAAYLTRTAGLNRIRGRDWYRVVVLSSRQYDATPASKALIFSSFALAPMTVLIEGHTVAIVLTVIVFTGRRRIGARLGLHIAGFSLLVAGLLVGEARLGDPDEIQNTVIDIVPIIAVLSIVRALARDRVHRRLARKGLVFGAVTSALLGLVYIRTPAGFALGLTNHRNQLAMTSVVAVALIVLLPTHNRTERFAKAAGLTILVFAVFATGSRSGILGLAVISVPLVVNSGRRPSRVIAVYGVLAAAMWIALERNVLGVANQAGRLTNPAATLESNAGRTEYLTDAIALLDPLTFLLGAGSAFDEPPHNIFVYSLVVGGILGLLGLLTVLSPPIITIAKRFSRVPVAPEVFTYATAALGFFVVVAFNNLLWAPFGWATLVLFHSARLEAAVSVTGRVPSNFRQVQVA